MKAQFLSKCGVFVVEFGAMAMVLSACHPDEKPASRLDGGTPTISKSRFVPESAEGPDACKLALVLHKGDGRIDQQIASAQGKARAGLNEFQSIERLGWLYVAKARESFDPGYYKLAEQCAFCLESRQPRSPEALLLRGHVLQNLHKFIEAEPLARELVTRRGSSFDYGLLGDVLMEQGRLMEAAQAYQKMVNEKPDLQSYARISHLRWLKGDLAGATEVMRLAVSAASPNAPESAAWVNTRLAFLQSQKGNLEEAFQTCDLALYYQKDYAPALLLRGRLCLGSGKTVEAIDSLTRAARLNPLPEYQWALSEALRAADRKNEAATVEKILHEQGATTDPRSFAIYLASHAESKEISLKLAQDEFKERSDVFTHDALAWALAANGKIEEASVEIERALGEGTKDARLFFHATVIAAKAGRREKAEGWLEKTAPMLRLLLPSEQSQLQRAALDLGHPLSADATVRN